MREYADLFKYTVQIDPNDPESTIEKTRTYSEVASKIRNVLIEQKTTSKADMVFNEAKQLAEAGWADLDIQQATVEQLRQGAGDYGQAAKELAKKYGIKVYTGKTGMLSQRDLANDEHLGLLSLEGQSMIPVALRKVVFAIDELATTTLGRFDVSKPKMWENIGPIKDGANTMVALVRVIEAWESSEPANIDTSFGTQPVVLEQSEEDEGNVYSVREQVVADCKLLKGMEQAKQWADELVGMIEENDWDKAIDTFNEAHNLGDTDDSKGAELRLSNVFRRSRISTEEIREIEILSAENPMAADYAATLIRNKELNDRLYSLLAPGQTEALNIKTVMEFKPGASCYVVKDVTRSTVTKESYYQSKLFAAYQVDAIRSDSLSLIHFLPDNIFKRMNYQPVNQIDEESSEQDQIEEGDTQE